jgi:HAD superfamily hydrolase (TIGR01549 family)
MLRHVILDFGGTLAREHPSRAEIYAQAGRRAGCEVGEERMAREMARAHADLPAIVEGAWRYSDEWFHAFIERIFVQSLKLEPRMLEGVRQELFARFADPATFRLYPGARELVRDLDAAGLEVSILSNWSRHLAGLVRGLGLAPPVRRVLSSAEEGLEKPDSAFFRLALERSGARPEEALHAGDRADLDCAGARAVGMRSVLVDHGAGGRAAAEGGFERVGSLHQLSIFILSGSP